MKIRINIDLHKKQTFLAVILISFITLLTLAIAITAVNPGHTSNDVTISIGGAEKTLQNAIDDGSLGRIAIFTSNGSFKVPAGITKVYLTMVGGGGGGGERVYSGGEGGRGGGGGGGAMKINFPFTVTPGSSYVVTIGGGGRGSIGGVPGNGANGGVTLFDTVSVPGGQGGFQPPSQLEGGNGHGGKGGGGIDAIENIGGGQTLTGGNGAPGFWNVGVSAGSGGGGGTLFGSGGNGGFPGSNGAGFGSGGGGGDGIAGSYGGNGASGLVIVMW